MQTQQLQHLSDERLTDLGTAEQVDGLSDHQLTLIRAQQVDFAKWPQECCERIKELLNARQ